MTETVAIIGGGINGLVAANYLRRNGYDVTILEKKERVGGACAVDSVTFDGVSYEYACGASVLGLMQDFVFHDTGLSEKLDVYAPVHPAVVYFEGDSEATFIHSDARQLQSEIGNRWGETTDVYPFFSDLERVAGFLCEGYRNAVVPTIESAVDCLGADLACLWISGTARDLLDRYFSSEKMKVFAAMDVVESGPVSIDSPYSAFTIPLMHSGTIFGGSWGFVKGRIWKVAEALQDLNRELGVNFVTSAEVVGICQDPLSVCYRTVDSLQSLQSLESLESLHSLQSIGSNKSDKSKSIRLPANKVIFATDPLSAARLLGDPEMVDAAQDKHAVGTSGKLVLIFKKPVIWKGDRGEQDFDMAFKFIISSQNLDDLERASQSAARNESDYVPGFIEIYCEGAAMRRLGETPQFDIVSAFVKNLAVNKRGADIAEVQKQLEQKVLLWINNSEDFIGSVLLTPKDLQERFFFPAGNIDHTELCQGQTFFLRHWSSDPVKQFYRFGNDERIMYCAAGSYPCGSIAGTPGYMCARQIGKPAPVPASHR